MRNTTTLVNSILKRHNATIRTPHLDKANMDIIQDLAVKFEMSELEIREIVTAPYLLLKKSRFNLKDVTAEDFLTFRVPKLGKFIPRPYRVKKYLARKEEKC